MDTTSLFWSVYSTFVPINFYPLFRIKIDLGSYILSRGKIGFLGDTKI